ncbi:hypothetical protein FKR81_30590 [Lentzea tibetensis]|uniref:Uncharacterized protein n=1 Tax=Lentzea tibetensis TaxID=2591470 RepID=A0A563EN32_9PSEU|nr:hypothetical protein [Lentzea tibetensis]TWP48014.1 hypothetical protein FKR81_30590 [Lentzea tibetensis]
MRFPVATAAVALVLATLPVTAQAAPSGCVWTPTALPMHDGIKRERVVGMSPDGSVAVGDGTEDGTLETRLRGLLWFGSTLVEMPNGGWGDTVDNGPNDVNNSGVVAGYTYDNDNGLSRPYRYRDGHYEWLPVPAGLDGIATDINEAGDIAGWLLDSRGVTSTILWRAGQPSVIIGAGQPIGLDDAGRVVTDQGLIWSPDGSTRTIKQRRDAKPRKYANGRVIGQTRAGREELVEWNLDGVVTRVLPGGRLAEGINGSGVVAGSYQEPGGKSGWAIWSGGSVQFIDGYAGGITENGIAFGENVIAGVSRAVVFHCR